MKIKTKHNKGFTLVELLAAVAIVGVIATIALPRYRSMLARSRTAEAKTNLAVLNSLQKEYRYIDYDEDPSPYKDKATGFHKGLHYGLDKCSDSPTEARNDLGFRLTDCSRSRYRYITNLGDDCAKSDGSKPQGQVYPNCNADDVWSIDIGAQLKHVKSVIDQCPNGAGGAPSSSCSAVAVALPLVLTLTSTTSPPSPSPPVITPPSCHANCADGCSDWVFDPWTAYSPAPISQCQGITFSQVRTRTATRTCSDLCADAVCKTSNPDSETINSIGTKPCGTPPPCRNTCSAGCSPWTAGAWGVWTPSKHNVCSGTDFIQSKARTKTRSCSNLCSGVACSSTHLDRDTRPAVGAGGCSSSTSDDDSSDYTTVSSEGGGGGGGGNQGGGGGSSCYSCCAGDFCVRMCGLSRDACSKIKNSIKKDTGVNTEKKTDKVTAEEQRILAQELVKRSKYWHDNLQEKERPDSHINIGTYIREKTSKLSERENEARQLAFEQLRKENPGEKIDFDDVTVRAHKLLNRDEEYKKLQEENKKLQEKQTEVRDKVDEACSHLSYAERVSECPKIKKEMTEEAVEEVESEVDSTPAPESDNWPKCNSCSLGSGGVNCWQTCTRKNTTTFKRSCVCSESEQPKQTYKTEKTTAKPTCGACSKYGKRRCGYKGGTSYYKDCTPTRNAPKTSTCTPSCGSCSKNVNKCWKTCTLKDCSSRQKQCTCPSPSSRPSPTPTASSCTPRCGSCSGGKKTCTSKKCNTYTKTCSSPAPAPAPKPKSCTPRCGSCSRGKKSCTSKTCRSYTKTCSTSSPAPAPKPKSCTPRCGSCSRGKKSCTSKACRSYTKTCSSPAPAPAPRPRATQTSSPAPRPRATRTSTPSPAPKAKSCPKCSERGGGCRWRRGKGCSCSC